MFFQRLLCDQILLVGRKIGYDQRLARSQAKLLHDTGLLEEHSLMRLTQIVGQPQLVALI